jgi:hypothetical protein
LNPKRVAALAKEGFDVLRSVAEDVAGSIADSTRLTLVRNDAAAVAMNQSSKKCLARLLHGLQLPWSEFQRSVMFSPGAVLGE